jgi:hypothetical protein
MYYSDNKQHHAPHIHVEYGGDKAVFSWNRSTDESLCKSIQFEDNYCLLLTFENGEKRAFDLKPYFEKSVFARLKNTALF